MMKLNFFPNRMIDISWGLLLCDLSFVMPQRSREFAVYTIVVLKNLSPPTYTQSVVLERNQSAKTPTDVESEL